MIETKVKIHDKFAFEIKTSFFATKKQIKEETEFNINMWMFVPNSLDISRSTYSKDQFYKDTISNIRLITPIYRLQDIYKGDDTPASRLRAAVRAISVEPDSELLIGRYTYQIKMYSSIVKSAIRDKVLEVQHVEDEELIKKEIRELYNHLHEIVKVYENCWNEILKIEASGGLQKYYLFGEEFLGNVIEQHVFALMRFLEDKPCLYTALKEPLINFILEINREKRTKGFPVAEIENSEANSMIIIRRSLLKKWIESDLYLNITRTKDGRIAQQFFYGMAAAVSMIFATVVSFTAQQRYGSFTTPLFFALVISYVFKDRIKELMRYYFSTQLGKKYFDIKRKLAIRELQIGSEKEAFDFVASDKLPEEISEMRKKSPLVEAENAIYGETILLYRKNVLLFSEKMKEYEHYKLSGINDITRISILNFIHKMDNPNTPLYIPDEDIGYVTVEGIRLYSIYFILRCQSETNVYYKQYRLLFNREGIKTINEIAS